MVYNHDTSQYPGLSFMQNKKESSAYILIFKYSGKSRFSHLLVTVPDRTSKVPVFMTDIDEVQVG